MNYIKILLVALALVAAGSAASARDVSFKHAREFRAYGSTEAHRNFEITNAYQNSGTRGRLGLGTDPKFPEGPGNPL